MPAVLEPRLGEKHKSHLVGLLHLLCGCLLVPKAEVEAGGASAVSVPQHEREAVHANWSHFFPRVELGLRLGHGIS